MRNQLDSECRREAALNAENIVYAHDLSGNITFLNEAGERISGFSREEACRMNIAEVIAPEFAHEVRMQLTRKFRERFGAVYEVEIITKDGRRVGLEVSMCAVFDKGQPIEIRGIAVPYILRGQPTIPCRLRCLDADFTLAGLLTKPVSLAESAAKNPAKNSCA